MYGMILRICEHQLIENEWRGLAGMTSKTESSGKTWSKPVPWDQQHLVRTQININN